jgi:hypothetical protein
MPKPIRRINCDQQVEGDAPSDSFFIGMVDGKIQKIRNNNMPKEAAQESMRIYKIDEDGEEIDLETIIQNNEDEDDEQLGGQE